jgi:putative ABC transport system permease protein
MHLFHLLGHHWIHRRGRMLVSVLSLAIAVAAVCGTMLAQSSVRSSYARMTQAVGGRPTLDILSAEGGTFPAAALPNLDKLVNSVTATASLARPILARHQGERFRTVLVGLPRDEVTVWEMLHFVRGRIPERDDEVVVGEPLADRLGLEVGDRLLLITRRGPRSVFASGIVTSASLNDMSLGSSLAIPLATLQEWFGQAGELSRFRLQFSSRGDREQARRVLESSLPDSLTVQTAHDQAELVDNILRATEQAVRLAGALSVVLATFIIVNVLRMNFSERRGELAILRVLGASVPQIVTLQLLEGGALGGAGAMLGIPGGVVLGTSLSHAMQSMLEIDLPGIELPWTSLALLFLVGPMIGCLGAAVPAWAARHVSPGEALRENELRQGERFPRWSVVAAGFAWIMAVTLLVLIIRESLAPELAVPAGLLMLAAFVLVIPALLSPLLRGFAWCGLDRSGFELHLAVEQLLRRPTRTGLAVGACVVAVSGGLGLGTTIGNHVRAIEQWQQRAMAGDLVLFDSIADGDAALAADRTPLQSSLQRDSRVDRYETQWHLPAQLNGRHLLCVFRRLDPDAPFPWNLPTRQEAVLRSAFADGGLILGAGMARQTQLDLGETARLETRGGLLVMPVVGIVDDFLLDGMVAFVDSDWGAARLDLGLPDIYIVHLNDPGDEQAVTRELEEHFGGEGIRVESFGSVRRQQIQVVRGITGGLWGLMAVGLAVSGFGMASTLTVNLFEQKREFGLLRIVGMTRSQSVRLVLWEAALLGLLGCLLGLVAGVTTAWVIHLCVEPLLGRSVPFSISGFLVLANCLGCALISLLAAWLPSRFIRRLDLLAAIADE